MNLTDIEETACELMDRYDMASRDLHMAIHRRGDIDSIQKMQDVVLDIRNEIIEILQNEFHQRV